MPYTIHHDFDQNTAYGARCTCCGNIKMPNHEGVFRPNTMDDFDGFHDICQACVEEAANNLGFAAPSVNKRLNTTIKNLRKDLAEARELFTESQETIRNLCRENSNLQEELTDLTSSFEPVE